MSSAAKVLTLAAELIRRHGWVQRKNGSYGEGFCLVGAVVFSGAGGLTVYPDTGFDFLMRVSGSKDLVAWNDTEGRTQEEVLELLEKAADAARNAG